MLHKGRPRLFAVHCRQEAADQKDGVCDRGFIHPAQIPVALLAERIGIEVDHVAVDEVVGRQALQDSVDPAVADVAGKGQEDVKIVEGADAFVDLFFDSAREVGGNDVCGPVGCMDMGGKVSADRVDAVFFEEDPVKFALDFFVGDLAAGGEIVDVAVAGAVKGRRDR